MGYGIDHMEMVILGGYIDDWTICAPVPMMPMALYVLVWHFKDVGYKLDIKKIITYISEWGQYDGKIPETRVPGQPEILQQSRQQGMVIVGGAQAGWEYAIGEQKYMKDNMIDVLQATTRLLNRLVMLITKHAPGGEPHV